MKDVVVQNSTDPMKMLKKLRIRCIQTDKKYHSCVYVTKFWQRNSHVRRKRPELWPNYWISLSSSFWPKNRLLKWNTHLTSLIWIRMTSGCFQK